jgi:hypothetical protein
VVGVTQIEREALILSSIARGAKPPRNYSFHRNLGAIHLFSTHRIITRR